MEEKLYKKGDYIEFFYFYFNGEGKIIEIEGNWFHTKCTANGITYPISLKNILKKIKKPE